MGHSHVARPTQLQQPAIRERPEPARCDASVEESVKRSILLCNKKISSTSKHNSANRGMRVLWLVETRQASEKKERVCGTSLLTHLPSGATFHLIYWSTSLPTFYVGLNLALTSCLCAANNLGCISYRLTYMGFEIFRNFWNLIWAHRKRPNISTIWFNVYIRNMEI
jgi:hypothetical protein